MKVSLSLIIIIIILNLIPLKYNYAQLENIEINNYKDIESSIKYFNYSDLTPIFLCNDLFDFKFLDGNQQNYTLNNKFNTPLQKKMFKQSEEYKQKIEEIQNIKNKITNNNYYISYNLYSEYDINKKQFIFNLNKKNYHYSQYDSYSKFSDVAPSDEKLITDCNDLKALNGVYMPFLPIESTNGFEAHDSIQIGEKNKDKTPFKIKQALNYIFIYKTDETNALEIEHGATLYIIFRPTKVINLTFNCYWIQENTTLNWDKDGTWIYDRNTKIIKVIRSTQKFWLTSGEARVIIAGENKIYFDHIYKETEIK